MSKRKIFSREFKLEALRSLDSGKKQATELARELGIPRSRLYAWRQQLQVKDASDAFLVTVGVPARMRSWLPSRQRTNDCGRTMRF
jgi:transposase-like protein